MGIDDHEFLPNDPTDLIAKVEVAVRENPLLAAGFLRAIRTGYEDSPKVSWMGTLPKRIIWHSNSDGSSWDHEVRVGFGRLLPGGNADCLVDDKTIIRVSGNDIWIMGHIGDGEWTMEKP